MESSFPKDHEDHIAERSFSSSSHFSLVHKFCSCAASDEDSECESSSGERTGEAGKVAGVAIDQVKSKKEVILEAQKEKRTVHVATLMDSCHLKNVELETKYQMYKGPPR